MSWALTQSIQKRIQAEVGQIYRPGAKRVLVLYPSPYRVGMSSLGFQWIASVLADAGFSVERAFLPDDPQAWRASRTPLLSYETLTPINEFPLIAVSVAYELELAGLISALELAGLDPLRENRGPRDPFVLIGGPLTFSNPLPAAPFADGMILGEAEESIQPVAEAAMFGYDECLKAIHNVPGGFDPERDGENLPPVAKAGDELLPARSRIITPNTELRNMFLIEGERGCHRTCTFCVMRRSTNGGMRLVTPDRILDFVPEAAEKVGLVGAAISDHPKLVPLLQRLVDAGKGVGISSLRADRVSLKPDIASLLRRGGYSTLTVASDASSQRLRRQISKGTTEKHLLRCAELAAKHKYKVLKIYMMLGLPDENDADLEELLAFSKELASIHPVALGIAPFVAKRNTPLDGTPFAGIKKIDKQLKTLSRNLRSSRVDVRSTSARWAWVEYMLAQSGSQAGYAVLEAVHNGGKFSHYKRALNRMDETTHRPWANPPMATAS